ncbi:helix-turn-helix domain-containing protein [Terribacillus sp. 179-K 1B1 HS]|uniref:TetR/AcrR family transcriptional regulator n=1 Tax=Terribacillus sp. 179-K 1B1 HS TaxID=3142388 RepID=UPI0039A2D235
MRERVMEETIQLLKIRGLSFTISELAQNLGTSKRTIYQHYDSKASLIGEIVTQLMKEIKQMEQEIMMDETLQISEKLRKLLVLLPNSYGVLDMRLLLDLKRHYHQQWIMLDEFMKQEWEAVGKIIDEGVNEGSIRPIQTEILIDLYIGAINELYAKNGMQARRMSIEEKLCELVDILLYGVLSETGKKEMER